MPETLDEIGAIAFTVGQIVAAIAVTVHVLLNKRYVGSAVGWIGITWISPILGSVLYVLFGINRVKRRASRLRSKRARRRKIESPEARAERGDHLCSLERAGDRITRLTVTSGNAVILLRNGDEAYPKMLAAIDAARTSIALSSYIFEADSVGNNFIDALVRAHQRGVQVRVLTDGVGSGYFFSPAHWRLRQNGVPALRFMHSFLPWRMPFLNLRIHKKILVVDGRLGFTGGMNIGAENLLQCPPKTAVRDNHFRFEGPVVLQLMEAFAEDWFFAAGENLADAAWFPPLEKAGNAEARVILSGPDEDLEKNEFVILEAIGCARHSIKVMTPYFLPDSRLVTALSLAAMRGVEVDVIIPTNGDHFIINWAIRAHLMPLLVAGCRIWQSPPPFNHAKTMLVDGIWCLIGSSNWDVRSFRLNFELDVEVYDPELVREVDQLMATKLLKPITAADINQRPFALRLLHGGARLMSPYL